MAKPSSSADQSRTPEREAERRPVVRRLALLAVFGCLLALGGFSYSQLCQPRSVTIRPASVLPELPRILTVAAASRDGRYLAVSDLRIPGTERVEVSVWDPEQPDSARYSLQGPKSYCNALSFHPQQPLLAIGGKGGFVQLANVESKDVVRTIEIAGFVPGEVTGVDIREVRDLEFSPDGRILAIGTRGNEIEIWSTETWQRLGTLPTHSDEHHDLSISSDGTRLVSVGESWKSIAETHSMKRSPVIVTWDTKDWSKPRERILQDVQELANQVQFVGAETIATGNNSGRVVLVDAATGKSIDQLDGHKDMIVDLAFDEENNLLFSTSPDATIAWDMSCNAEVATLDGSLFVAVIPKSNQIATVDSRRETRCRLSRVLTGIEADPSE